MQFGRKDVWGDANWEPYYYVKNKLNWFDAQLYCKYHGMNLISVLTAKENEKLLSYLDAGELGKYE